MKIFKTVSLSMVGLFAMVWAPLARAADGEIVPVAVLDLEATEPRLKERGAQLALLLSTQLSTLDGIATVERQELAKLLGEQELGNSGMVEPATAARIGHLTGARVLVTGRVFTIGGESTAALKVMSTETGRVFGAAETFAVDASLKEPVGKLSAKISDILKTKKDDLIARPASVDDRIARLKKQLTGKVLPSVTISIPEQHIGPAVIDPAAETEIGLILGQVGFALLTDSSAGQADFQIKGEAFSEAGIRRGNLVSCRARVEVKVTALRDGKIVLMDRQVAWAVDSAEHIAAKTALQQAGAKLAERLADVLVSNKQPN
jgi:hypothetical protein